MVLLSVVKLSVVIITHNEERNIERCLLSVKSIADEIVVLDSFSNDKTKEICEKYEVKFFQHAFDGHIQQKNRAISYASNDHVLSLDADEALDDNLIDSISKVKSNFEKDGYEMNRLTNYCGHWVKHCGWYPDTKLRLWDCRKGEWRGKNPHDKYELFDGNNNIGQLKGDILHYSYYSTQDHYKQVEYFTNIAAKEFIAAHGKAPFYKIVLNPLAKFIGHYLLNLGFLDGKAGYQISKISAYATYLKYKKIKQFYQQGTIK